MIPMGTTATSIPTKFSAGNGSGPSPGKSSSIASTGAAAAVASATPRQRRVGQEPIIQATAMSVRNAPASGLASDAAAASGSANVQRPDRAASSATSPSVSPSR